MPKQRGGIPDRWLDYYPLGKQIVGTRFIAFKVPLKEALCSGLRHHDRFTPRLLVQQVPRLGLVVDLTNTSRYYSQQDLEHQGVKHQKLMCPGHAIPPKALVRRFYNIVDHYIGQTPNPQTLIGVHCTHGLNRSSFFVCSYMIERLGMAPQDALTAFQNARGYNVERENYIEELSTLKPLSAPPMDKLESRYPTLQQPDLAYQHRNRQNPALCKILHRAKMAHTDKTFKSPVPAQYGGSQQQCGSYQNKQRPFRRGGWNANNGRQPQMVGHLSNGTEQQQMFASQMYNGNSSGRGRVLSECSTKLHRGMLNNFRGSARGVMASDSSYLGDRRMPSVNNYRNFGDSNLNGRERMANSRSRSNGRGRMMNNNDPGVSVNMANNDSNVSGTSRFDTKGPWSQKIPKHHATWYSTAYSYADNEKRKFCQSSKVPS